MNEPMPSGEPNKPADTNAELRSDVSPSGPLKPASPLSKDQKKLAYLGGGIVVLLLIGLGVYAGLRPGGDNEGADNGGIFGDLPMSDERAQEEEAKVSGLSGRTCDDYQRRPIGVMLAGDPINRPVSGFAAADLVFELPVLVNDVTRLLAVYQCGQPGDIGSVRSVRHDYLFLAEGVDAIVGHWGGSYHALNRIAVGEFNTLNALTNPHNAYFRKNHLPAPYNGFTTYERLWNALEKLGYRTTTEQEGYEFKDDIDAAERPSGGTLTVGWPGAFQVRYEYNPETNRYDRYWGGTKQVDGEDNTTPVAPSSVVIMRATNQLAVGEGGYNDVGIEGEGDMTVYQDGKVIPGRWRKNELQKTDPVHFMNEQGDPIIFTRGQIWIMAVEPHIAVNWVPAAATPEPASAPAQ